MRCISVFSALSAKYSAIRGCSHVRTVDRYRPSYRPLIFFLSIGHHDKHEKKVAITRRIELKAKRCTLITQHPSITAGPTIPRNSNSAPLYLHLLNLLHTPSLHAASRLFHSTLHSTAHSAAIQLTSQPSAIAATITLRAPRITRLRSLFLSLF